LEWKLEKSLLMLQQYDTTVLPFVYESLVYYIPITKTPSLWIDGETFGTHSLFPIFADIWRRTLVKIDAKFLFLKVLTSVTWLFTYISYLNVILLMCLYWLLKVEGMINQKRLALPFSFSFRKSPSIFLKAFESPKLIDMQLRE